MVALLMQYLPQNCKQWFMYINNWDKGVAPAICPCIFSTVEYLPTARATLYLLVASSL